MLRSDAGRGGFAPEPCPSPFERRFPRLTAGMKKGTQFPGHAVEPGNIWSLAQITAETGQGEIGIHRESSVLFRDDMIAVKREAAHHCGEVAVFTPVSGALDRSR